jgi:hypothetical protein
MLPKGHLSKVLTMAALPALVSHTCRAACKTPPGDISDLTETPTQEFDRNDSFQAPPELKMPARWQLSLTNHGIWSNKYCTVTAQPDAQVD